MIYLDIGGTTAKCSDIEDGKPKVSTEYRLEYSRSQFGYPLRVPVVDIVEIGAGGGSIAWFDKAGLLKVGPVSAGAEPGPACYGRGGTEPTVTDAKLITGVLNPEYFANGQFTLDENQARLAMQVIADGMDCSVEQAAVAVIRTVDANMINALKLVSIQRGHDPRDFALVVGGGGGAMHGAPLGRELGVKEVVIPIHPGLFSAWGMLATEPRRDFMQTALGRAEDIAIEGIRELFAGLEAEAQEYFRADGHEASALSSESRIDLRYLGQEHSVTVPVDLASATVASILDDFHAAHERTYTFALDDTPRRIRYLSPDGERAGGTPRTGSPRCRGALGRSRGQRRAHGRFRRRRAARGGALRARSVAPGIRGRRPPHRRGAEFDHPGSPRSTARRRRLRVLANHRGLIERIARPPRPSTRPARGFASLLVPHGSPGEA